MSDFEELANRKVSAHISATYSSMVAVCLTLPLPVTLPTGMVSNLEVVPAVRRLMELTLDQPMPETMKAHVFAAAAFWLGAMDCYSLLIREEEWQVSRAHSAAANLLMADGHLEDLAAWLGDQE
ncbi:hypothetical protein [Streptomyces sp. NPDC007117]|uniref:hypothetical protein n=1 Tax=Streptomyces sp. NPDC007117 TaxID=3154314 RepID=UPI003405C482